MQPAWKTVEFWAVFITNVVGVIALFGGVTSDQASDLINGLTQISGALLMLGTSFGFVKARIEMRTHLTYTVINSMMGKTTNSLSDTAANIVCMDTVSNNINATLKTLGL